MRRDVASELFTPIALAACYSFSTIAMVRVTKYFFECMVDDDIEVPLDPDLAAEALLESEADPEEEVDTPHLDAFGAPIEEE